MEKTEHVLLKDHEDSGELYKKGEKIKLDKIAAEYLSKAGVIAPIPGAEPSKAATPQQQQQGRAPQVQVHRGSGGCRGCGW